MAQETVNGWIIEKRPNTFAEAFRYQAVAVNSEGYQVARHGFQTKRECIAFAASHTVGEE